MKELRVGDVHVSGLFGVGCLPFSAKGLDADRVRTLLRRFHAAGVRLLDTADVYGPDMNQPGQNERLLASALRGFTCSENFHIATKGGCISTGSKWIPRGTPEHLRRACEASLKNLNSDRIDLYQLHLPDPDVELEVSVEALAHLKAEGKIQHIGLCNVSVDEVSRALRVTEIKSVQINLNPLTFNPNSQRMIEFCKKNELLLIGHSPLGGLLHLDKLHSLPGLQSMAERYSCSTFSLLLAWQLSLGVFPIPGFSRLSTFEETCLGLGIELQAADIDSLKEL